MFSPLMQLCLLQHEQGPTSKGRLDYHEIQHIRVRHEKSEDQLLIAEATYDRGNERLSVLHAMLPSRRVLKTVCSQPGIVPSLEEVGSHFIQTFILSECSIRSTT